MKKAAVVLLMLVAVMMIAPAAFAQGGGDQGKAPLNPTTLALAAGFGVAIAAVGGGLGQGRIAAAACEALRGIRERLGACALPCCWAWCSWKH